MTQTRLRILTKSEINALYGVPCFSDNERRDYFSLNDAEIDVLESLGSTKSQAYFIMQLGYFKATTLFFPSAFLKNREDLSFIMKRFFPKSNQPLNEIPSDKTRLKIHENIIELAGFQASKQEIQLGIQSMLAVKVTVSPNPIHLFYEILSYLQEKKMVLLAYSVLQELVSEAIAKEQQRICNILRNDITHSVKLSLDRLLLIEDGLYTFTSLKRDPKNFRTKHIKAEIKKLENNRELYYFALSTLPKLMLTNQIIQYYASLAEHYSIERLTDLPESQTQLYLLCYIYHRYQQINDNLITCFMHLIEKYYDEAKIVAKDIIFNEKIPISNDSKKAAKILEFYIDDNISNDMPFGKVRKKAFRLLSEEKFSDVIQFIIGVLFDFEKTCWDELAKCKAKITANIRPIFEALDFGCTSEHAPLLSGIAFLKNRFLDKNKSTVPPLTCVPSEKRAYLSERSNGDVDLHRYEFMIYRLIKEQFESGKTFVNDSVSYKNFDAY